MLKRSKRGRVVLFTWSNGEQFLRVRQNNPHASARVIPGWTPFFVGRHGTYVVHSYRRA